MTTMHVSTLLFTDALQHMPEWSHSKPSRNSTLPSLGWPAHSHCWLLGCHCPLQPDRALGHRDSEQQSDYFYWIGKCSSFCSLPQCSSVFPAFGSPFASGRWGRAQTRWCCCHCSRVMLSRRSGQSWSSALSLSHAGASQWAPLSTPLWGLGHGPKAQVSKPLHPFEAHRLKHPSFRELFIPFIIIYSLYFIII